MITLIAQGLLVIDCLVVVIWVTGFALMPFDLLHGLFSTIHFIVVLTTAVAQIMWGLRCPLMVWRNRIIGKEVDVLNPYLIQMIQKIFQVKHGTANMILSVIIFAGALFY